MRDIVLTAVLLGAIPLALFQPWIGVLVWSWLNYMNPHRLAWGFAAALPVAKMASLATLIGLGLFGDPKLPPRRPEVVLLGLFWLWITVTTFFAYYPAPAWEKWQEVSKTLLVATVTVLLFQDGGRLKWLVWTIVASLGFFSVKSGVNAMFTGFQGGYAYPPASFIADNNDLALAFNMMLPLIWFLSTAARQAWLRWGLRLALVLTVMGVLTTRSRGGFLGLCAVVLVLVLRARVKMVAVGVLACVVLVGTVVLPENTLSRVETIGEYDRDHSAQGRLRAWMVATKVAVDSPLVGGGFKIFGEEIWRRYDPGARHVLVAHSIYFQVLGEHGFVGLAIFLALLGATHRALVQTASRARGTSTAWVAELAGCIQASLVAYMVSGAFLSRSDFDLFYQLVAVAAVLPSIVEREAAASEAAEPARPAVAAQTPWWRRPVVGGA